MSAINWIGRKTEKGTEYISCYWGGYFDQNGKILSENYTTDTAVEDLLSLGDARFIDKTLELSEFYARDKGEPFMAPRRDIDSNFRPSSADNYELCFLWNKGEWWVSGMKRLTWTKLKQFNLESMEGDFKDEVETEVEAPTDQSLLHF